MYLKISEKDPASIDFWDRQILSFIVVC